MFHVKQGLRMRSMQRLRRSTHTLTRRIHTTQRWASSPGTCKGSTWNACTCGGSAWISSSGVLPYIAIQKPPGNKALSDPATRSGKDEKARALTT